MKHIAYHVDNNKDVFFKEIMEGIHVILIGKVCNFNKPLVIVGGNREQTIFDHEEIQKFQYCLEYIRGYDIDGNEKLWIVTSGNVNSLALVDVNNDGKNEVNPIFVRQMYLIMNIHFSHRLFAALTMDLLSFIKMIRFFRNFLKIQALYKFPELILADYWLMP